MVKKLELNGIQKETWTRAFKRYHIPYWSKLKDEFLEQLDSICEYLDETNRNKSTKEKRFVLLEELCEATEISKGDMDFPLSYLLKYGTIIKDTYTKNGLRKPLETYALNLDARKIENQRLSERLSKNPRRF